MAIERPMKEIDPLPWAAEGFALWPGVLCAEEVDGLTRAVENSAAHCSSRRGGDYAARNLLRDVPVVREAATAGPLGRLARRLLGNGAFPVRGILFDKVSAANWHVGWHQDTMIPVVQRREVPGFGPWSVKAGVAHVKPPALVLATMLTLRVHLDDCGAVNGPLRVLPGSHRHGYLSSDQIQQWMASVEPVTCTAVRGDVLAMKPLLLHASSPAASARHRRVLHIEYAAHPLPGGLQWGTA